MNTQPDEENVTVEESEPVASQQHRLSSTMPIIIFSYIGVLIRLGLSLLGNNQSPLNQAFWPNFVGCLIMGFVVEQKIHIHAHFAQLYIGLSTGLCGSITTFSGLMYASCIALFGPSSHQTYPVSNFLAVLISALSASFVGFVVGRHLSIFIFSKSSLKEREKRMHYFNKHIQIWLFPILIFISIPVLVLLAVLAPSGHYTYFIYSCIFAPFGSLTRYVLALFLNSRWTFPFGTFLANVSGSFIYLGIVAARIYSNIPFLNQQVLMGIIQGYCGCLTTVSTFILELNTIKKHRDVYIYFLATVLPVEIVFIIFGDSFSTLCSSLS